MRETHAKPLVSVIMPTYNYAGFIAEALESVRAQSYENWECLVIDDGSTDDTREVVARCAESDERIRYIYQRNQRQAVAKNNGLKNSVGQYIQFLDADDLIERRKLEQQVAYLESHSEVDIVYGGARYFSTENPGERLYSMWGEKEKPWMPEVSGSGSEILRELVRNNIMVISSPLVRRSVIDEVGLFDKDLPPAEDWEYWVRCAIKGKRFDYRDFPESLSLIRSHADSSSRDGRLRCAAILQARKRIQCMLTDAESIRINRQQFAVDEAYLGFEEVKHGNRRRAVYHILRAGFLDQRFKHRMKWFLCALGAPLLSREQFDKLPTLSLKHAFRDRQEGSK